MSVADLAAAGYVNRISSPRASSNYQGDDGRHVRDGVSAEVASGPPVELRRSVDELRAENAALRTENARLREHTLVLLDRLVAATAGGSR